MADTSVIPERPQRHLGACTTTELSTYEADLRDVLSTSRDAAERVTIMHEIGEVEAQWETRERIAPGYAGRTWPIHN